MIANIFVNSCFRIWRDSVIDGHLPAGALLPILTVIDAVATRQKTILQVDVDAILRDSIKIESNIFIIINLSLIEYI